MNSEDAIIYSTIRAFISMQKKKNFYPNIHYSTPCGNAEKECSTYFCIMHDCSLTHFGMQRCIKWLCVFQSICYQVFVLSKSKAVGTLKCEKKNTVMSPYFQLHLKFIAVLCNSSVVMHTERNAVWLQCNWREDMKCYHFPDIVVRCVGRWYFGFSLHGLKAVCERQMIQIMAAYFFLYSPCEWHILITKAAPCLALDP